MIARKRGGDGSPRWNRGEQAQMLSSDGYLERPEGRPEGR
jgi:hypothetical protein